MFETFLVELIVLVEQGVGIQSV